MVILSANCHQLSLKTPGYLVAEDFFSKQPRVTVFGGFALISVIVCMCECWAFMVENVLAD